MFEIDRQPAKLTGKTAVATFLMHSRYWFVFASPVLPWSSYTGLDGRALCCNIWYTDENRSGAESPRSFSAVPINISSCTDQIKLLYLSG